MAFWISSGYQDPSGYDSVQACKSLHMLIFFAESSSWGRQIHSVIFLLVGGTLVWINFVKPSDSFCCKSSNSHLLLTGSCKDINSASVGLYEGAISDAISKQKWLHINAKF